jgi:1A family penicillin-binding protein
VLRWLLIGSFLITIILCALTATSIYIIARIPLPATEESTNVAILDHANQVISVTKNQQHDNLTLNEISPHLIKATIAIEDRRFYQHGGFDWRGITRAIWINLKEQKKVQGASTLTQQLARNLYLSHEKTWTRKVYEAKYTLQLEHQWKKPDILIAYLNHIYYGHGAYGAEAAAITFFDKHANELSLAESAMVAGIPKGPKYYSPLMNEAAAKKRQRLVLMAMVRNQFITQLEADRAYGEPLKYKRGKRNEDQLPAPYFNDYVMFHELERIKPAFATQQTGLRIHTTIDSKMQQIAVQTIDKQLKKYPGLQVSLIAIEPSTGYIKAMIGGRDYRNNQFNRALSRTRQPGSTFKPIVYLTALMNGATATSQQRSEPVTFTFDDGKRTYAPKNFANHYAYDWIDMRRAIAQSDNIYAVKTLLDVGPEKVIEISKKLGISANLKPLPSLALGSFPISPLELTGAYSAIANHGIYVSPSAITAIHSRDGQLLYKHKQQKTKVSSAEHAFVMTQLMKSVFDKGGTAYRVAHMIKRPVAGKTGTTNTDAWMIGFTPHLVTGIWLGYDQGRQITTSEAYLAAPIFADFIERASAHQTPTLFDIPTHIVSLYIDEKSGKLADETCLNQRLEHFVQGTEPQQFCSNRPKLNTQPSPIQSTEELERSLLEQIQHWFTE